MKEKLSIEIIKNEAQNFSISETNHHEPLLFGITDGKAVGTYLEQKFKLHLQDKYQYMLGNSAKGIDFPELNVDIKVTSIKQPQSSCPFRSARQKIFGLGYSLLIFVYNKTDNHINQTANLEIINTVFVDAKRTADFQTTTGLRKIIENNGNIDDIVAFLSERFLPVDDVEAYQIAESLINNPPEIGYLTISNALQWRLQYRRVINNAGVVLGIDKII